MSFHPTAIPLPNANFSTVSNCQSLQTTSQNVMNLENNLWIGKTPSLEKIETQKLSFKETAKSRTNTGVGGEKQKSRSTSRTGSICSSQDGSIQE